MRYFAGKMISLTLISFLFLAKGSEAFVKNANTQFIGIPKISKGAITIRPWPSPTKPVRGTFLHLSPVDLVSSESMTAIEQMFVGVTQAQAEALAGPFFGLSLFPYLAFLYFLNVNENECPKGVTVGFATCLLFVFLSIPAAIASKILYGVSFADCDWLHGSAESLLMITNLVTVIAFRQALRAKEENLPVPKSAENYGPMVSLVAVLTCVASVTALVPLVMGATVHTPYLGGFMDLSYNFESLGANPEPENALTVATWIVHVSSLVEWLVVMGFVWRWADVVDNPKWKGLTWGLLPLHSSGIVACVYHLLYNQIPIMVPLQAILTCFGNSTAAYAALRIALSNGWVPSQRLLKPLSALADQNNLNREQESRKEPVLLVGFEDIGDLWEGDNDYSFLLKLFGGCALASYGIKYGELFLDFPFDAQLYVGMSLVIIPSMLNAFKWYKRSQDPKFDGWF